MKKNYFKNPFNMIFYNFRTFICFEFLFKMVLSLLLLPCLISSIHIIMKNTGYTYITSENIFSFLFNPFTFLLMCILFVFLAFITIYDISTMIVIFDASYHKKKISLRDAMKISFSKYKNLFQTQNVLVCFVVLFLIPFLNIGIESDIISSFRIPDFVIDYMITHRTILLCYVAFYVFLLVVFFQWLFSLHYMIIEDKNFKNARNCSRELIHKHELGDYIKIFFGRILFVFLFMIVLAIGYFLLIGVHQIFLKYHISQSSFILFIWILLVILLFSFVILSNGVSYAIISSLFYKHKEDKNEKIHSIRTKIILKSKKKTRFYPFFLLGVFLLSLLGGFCLYYQIIMGQANFNVEFLRELEVTAHRGASSLYPENTMAAFRGAKDLGADWIELDVQQTKDGEAVIMHDTNLYRVAGVDQNIYDLTYEELQQLEVGSYFDESFRGEKIPLLSEVVEFASESGIRLMIEIKPTGHEQDLEKQVLDIIHHYHFEDYCIVASASYDSIRTVKLLDSNIRTLLIMGLAYGDITKYDYADIYSVETLSVDESLVHLVHKRGKEIFVWTVDTEEGIQEMIELNVDNIITDDVELCRGIIVKNRGSNMIQEYIDMLQE